MRWQRRGCGYIDVSFEALGVELETGTDPVDQLQDLRLPLTIRVRPGGVRISLDPRRHGTRSGSSSGTVERVLRTVLVTDLVGSTEAAAAHDGTWLQVLDGHNAVVRAQLDRYDGVEVNTTGDGFLAVFDGPGGAIRCARAIAEGVHDLGLRTRAGIHTGEVERRGPEVGGLALHIGARVADLAAPDEVLVSQVVPGLVTGSDLAFRDRGTHTLKGVPGRWQVFAAC